MYDVAIIGAGITGAMAARELSRYDLNVIVIEKDHDVACGATRANSAIVHAGFDAECGSLKAKMNVQGSELMENVCKELGVKYQRNGSLVVAYREEDLPKVQVLYERGVQNGVRDLKVVRADELFELEPSISKEAKGALYAPTGAIICPYEFNIAAMGNAMDNGVSLLLDSEVTAIEKKEASFVITAGSKNLESRFVVNAAGLYSDAIARMIGDSSFTVHPRKGQYMLLDHDCVGDIRHTLFNIPNELGKGILVSPTVDNNLILGPTAEDGEDKEDKTTTPEGLNMVSVNARKVIPSVNLRGVITQFSGLRAVGSTHDFIINAPVKGFVNCAGIESPGLSSAPAIALYVKELLAGEGLELKEKKDFNPCREAYHEFNKMTMEEKNKVIAKDCRYGQIICRCESISEGEIVAALHQNPPARDLDGVKRRTRAGMGRCQGGFCSTMVMQIIAREQNLPLEEVTKFGHGSYLVLGKTRKGGTQA